LLIKNVSNGACGVTRLLSGLLSAHRRHLPVRKFCLSWQSFLWSSFLDYHLLSLPENFNYYFMVPGFISYHLSPFFLTRAN
jgi:hypothetical protein